MRGEVLYYDEAQGFGFLQGADGNRYTFTAENLRRPMEPVKGAAVEFQPKGDKARAISFPRTQGAPRPENRPAGAPPVVSPPATAAPALSASPHFGRPATNAGDAEPTGLWNCFRRGLTEKYAAFSGRARRKEYWGYVLFWTLALSAICVIGLIADGAAGNLGQNAAAPYMTLAATGAFVLATILPGVAITVRRIHDIGLSGWFYLLIFVPSVGALIILVFSLVPSQKSDNKWGPAPEGVRI